MRYNFVNVIEPIFVIVIVIENDSTLRSTSPAAILTRYITDYISSVFNIFVLLHIMGYMIDITHNIKLIIIMATDRQVAPCVKAHPSKPSLPFITAL